MQWVRMRRIRFIGVTVPVLIEKKKKKKVVLFFIIIYLFVSFFVSLSSIA